MEYHYSENTRKSVLRTALLFRVYSEFIQNEWKINSNVLVLPCLSPSSLFENGCQCFIDLLPLSMKIYVVVMYKDQMAGHGTWFWSPHKGQHSKCAHSSLEGSSQIGRTCEAHAWWSPAKTAAVWWTLWEQVLSWRPTKKPNFKNTLKVSRKSLNIEVILMGDPYLWLILMARQSLSQSPCSREAKNCWSAEKMCCINRNGCQHLCHPICALHVGETSEPRLTVSTNFGLTQSEKKDWIQWSRRCGGEV